MRLMLLRRLHCLSPQKIPLRIKLRLAVRDRRIHQRNGYRIVLQAKYQCLRIARTVLVRHIKRLYQRITQRIKINLGVF
jgi:hypothetical protein